MNAPPPIESLIANSSQAWSSLCTDQSQIAHRTKLRRLLDIASPYKMATDQIELYEELNNLLQSGVHDRFVLYCPLFIVPSVTWYRQHTTIDTFLELYLAAWGRLLEVRDPKADFTDGDVDGELQMVCQAAQLGPYLFAKKLINRQSYTKYTLYHQPETKSTAIDKSVTYSEAIRLALIDQTDYSNMSASRAKWFQREWRHRTIQSLAKTTAEMLLTTPYEVLRPTNDDAVAVMITAIGMSCERGSCEHRDKLLDLARNHPNQRQHIIRTLSRMHSAGQCGRYTLEEFGIRYPNLSGPHFKHITAFDVQTEIVEAITQRLSDSCYPVCLTFGSQLKGYAQPSSDTDLAVILKPDAKASTAQVRGILGDVAVFTTSKDREHLTSCHADAHLLFDSVWTGDQETFDYLAKHLLSPYALANQEHLLRAIEHDIIQYRLLHHGYETYNPTAAPTFFDEGFRRAASKLYVSNILIP